MGLPVSVTAAVVGAAMAVPLVLAMMVRLLIKVVNAWKRS